MSLAKYRQKRDFAKTAEPSGKTRRKPGNSYVIQKHDASHLHYDFRLELDGVLLSWAVPKGPTLDPSVKRLAVQTEDHPLEYGGFEGSIPAGEYGGGTVMVWDIGTYELLDGNYHKGRLRVHLRGSKLKGEWELVRRRKNEERDSWLLIKAGETMPTPSKKRDDTSAISRRSMHQIAEAADATWTSNR